MDWTIRQMEERDLDEVSAIEKSIFSIPWSRKSLQDAMNTPDNVYIVCETDGRIAGYCGMWTVLGEGNIVNVAVDEHYRKNGIARALMQELVKRGLEKNVNIFFVEVRAGNEAAKHLYETEGFRNIGVRKNFYEKPVEDAYVMSKIL